MNKRDRELLGRLRVVIDEIPLPHDSGGTKTASLRGMVRFQSDMRNALPLIKRTLDNMILQSLDGPEVDLEEGWDYTDPGETLAELETWIKSREAQSWE